MEVAGVGLIEATRSTFTWDSEGKNVVQVVTSVPTTGQVANTITYTHDDQPNIARWGNTADYSAYIDPSAYGHSTNNITGEVNVDGSGNTISEITRDFTFDADGKVTSILITTTTSEGTTSRTDLYQWECQ